MKYTIFDLEGDGLLDTITKIHCLSYNILNEKGVTIDKGSFTDYDDMRLFMNFQECLIGHNVVRYDIPVIKKILGISLNPKTIVVDTLGLSWYLYPMTKDKEGNTCIRRLHGLEAWGEELGVKKPEVKDWSTLDIKEYIFRCESDVEINRRLWLNQKAYLERIYNGEDIFRIIGYLGFKLDCAREQEENPVTIDKMACEKYLEQIQVLREEKIGKLVEFMPKNPKYKVVKKPKNMYKADGNLSKIGEKWVSLLADTQSSEEVEELKILSHYEEGNPGSSAQVKDWLFSLGWIPENYKDSVSKATGAVKEVAQISTDGEICPNIKKLYGEHPYLENLESLTILTHRKGVFESFLEAVDKNNQVQAKIDGFTPSLRFQHRKPIANLCKVSKPWGKEIRSLITVSDPEKYILCGSDMSSLEDSTKRHFMYFFDPEYVKLIMVPGFDPHTYISVLAKIMTPEEETFYKNFKKGLIEKTEVNEKKYHEIESKRYLGKTTNFGAVYGAGVPKLAKVLGCSLDFARKLHKTYWELNKAVKQVAENTIRKVVDGQMFLYNPVSRFWYVVRVEKDIFSVLNQGLGVYCFDLCIRKYREKGIKIRLQYHDEVAFMLNIDKQDETRAILMSSVKEVNDEVKLNVPLGISVDFGENYSMIH